MYAGPPAYRWYGYGSPSPGNNPYAPTGRYPQASGTWFTQTGATPGAFPVPIGGMPVTPREQPVVVQAFPQEPPRTLDSARPAGYRPVPETLEPVSPPPRSVVAETPRFTDPREPQMPVGPGAAAEPGTPPDLTWLPASANSRVPIAATPEPRTLPVPVAPSSPAPPPSTSPGTDWGPSRRPTPPDAPLPTVTISRGQAPTAATVAPTEADVDAAIRSACFGRASRVGVSRPGPQKLHVTLVVPTEADARDAAAVVSRLPELKTLAVTFEAVIGK